MASPSIMPEASPTFCGRSSCPIATATANVDQRQNPKQSRLAIARMPDVDEEEAEERDRARESKDHELLPPDPVGDAAAGDLPGNPARSIRVMIMLAVTRS